MTKLPILISRTYRSKKLYPPCVQCVEQRERYFRRRGLRLCELCPTIFGIRFDRRSIFGQRQLPTDIGVHVTVWKMMDNLPHRPSTVAIGSIELLRGETRNCGAQCCGRSFNVTD